MMTYPTTRIDATRVEDTDPRNEELILAHWQPVLKELGIAVLGIRPLLTRPQRLTVDGLAWDIRPMDLHQTYEVPAFVHHRVQAAQEWRVPFTHWYWAEETAPVYPKLRPTPQRPPVGKRLTEAFRTVKEWFDNLDPLLIAVIPTGPDRGIFCCVGKWLH